MAKVMSLLIVYFTSLSALSLEKCNYQLVPEFFKIGINFYTEDEKLEQKGYFTDLTLKGSLYGNSIRSIIKELEVFIPFNNLNTYNTSRDRIIYNHLVSIDTEKKGQIHVKINSLEKKRVKLQITVGNISKEVIFKYDSRDVSMQSIGYIDLEDFNLIAVKKVLESKYNHKIWNDVFLDIRAKFNKNCEQEL